MTETASAVLGIWFLTSCLAGLAFSAWRESHKRKRNQP